MKRLESYYNTDKYLNIDKYLNTNKYLNTSKYYRTGLGYTPKYKKLNLKSKPSYLPIEEDRSIIDRLFDVMSIGNYTIAGAVKSFQDGGSIWSGAWEGLKAANPLGSGYTKGEVTWSDVLENGGWKTDTTGGKIARGAVGFLLDVLLDPLTYVSFGGAAILKGTGKAALKSTHGKLIRKVADEFSVDISEGMTEEAAKKIILKQSFRRNYDIADDVLEVEAKNLVKRFNNVLGIRPEARDITLSLKNMPFGEKLFPNSEVFKLVDGKTLQKLGDSTGIAPKYAILRDKIYGSVLGKHFSTITPLYYLSKTDPGAFYDFVRYVDYVRGLNADRLAKNQMIINAAKELANLTPAQNKQLIELIEDASKWHYVTDAINFVETKLGQRKRIEMVAKAEQMRRKLGELVEKRNNIQNIIKNSENKIGQLNETLAKLEKEYQEELFNIDLKNISESSTRQRYLELFQEEIDRIEAQKAEIVSKASKTPVDEKSLEYEQSIKEIQERVATLKLEAKNITKQLKKLKQEEANVVKSINKEKEEIATTLDAAKQAEINQLMKRMDEIRNEYKNIKSKDYSSLHKPLVDEWESIKSEKTKPSYNKYSKIEFVRKLSTHLTGNPKAIGFSTYDRNIDIIIDMMRKGVPYDEILDFIAEHSKYFDGTFAHMYSWIAKQLNYESWVEAYIEPRRKLLEAIRKEGMTAHNSLQYDKLENLRQKRQFLISKLEDSKDAKELMRRISDFEDMMLMSGRKDVIYREMQLKKAAQAQAMTRKIDTARITDLPPEKIIDDMLSEKKYKTREEAIEAYNKLRGTLQPGKVQEETYPTVLSNIIEAEKRKKEREVYNFNLTSYDIDDMYAYIDQYVYKKLKGNEAPLYKERLIKSLIEDVKKLNQTFEWKDLNGNKQKINWTQLTDKQKEILVGIAYRRHFGHYTDEELAEFAILDKVQAAAKKTLKDRYEAEKISHIIDNVNIGDDVEIKLYGKDSDADLMNVTITDYRLHDKKHGQIFEYTGINKADGSEVTFYPTDVVNILKIGKVTDIEGLIRQSEVTKRAVQYADELKDEYIKLQDELAIIERKYAFEAEKQIANLEQKILDIELTYGSKVDNLEEAREALRDEIKELQRQTKNEKLRIARLRKKQELADELEAKRIAEELASLESKLLEKQKAIMQLQTNERYFSNVRARKIENATREFERRAASIRNNIERYESIAANYAEKLKRAEFETLDKELEELQTIEKAIESDDFFDSYMRSELGNEKVDKAILKEKFDVIEIALNEDIDIDDRLREVANFIRSEMVKWGREEVDIGKLNKGQLYANLKSYLPHILTPEGEMLLARQKATGGIEGFGDSFGYGREFNQYARSRTFVIKNDDGTFNMKPTIIEANEYFKKLAKGDNVFSDVLSDIYMARGLKHNDLMYDDAYMRSMLEMFGDDLIDGIYVKSGYKAVMNFGMAQDGMKNMANLAVRTHISDAVNEYLENPEILEKIKLNVNKQIAHHKVSSAAEYDYLYKKLLGEEITKVSNKFIKEMFPLEERKKLFQESLTNVIELSGMKNSLEDIATPMLELSTEQIEALKNTYEHIQRDYLRTVKRSYISFIRGKWYEVNGEKIPGDVVVAMNRAMENLSPAELKEFINNRIEAWPMDELDRLRIDKMLEKIDESVKHPLQIKQVNDAIVEKANRMRKVQIAKDNSRMLQLWDKVTHFIKLNQTTIMPSFHLRNKYSNMFNNWLVIGLDAIDPRLQKASAQTIYYMRKNEPEKISKLTININGEEKQWSELYQLAMQYDVIDEGFFKMDLGTGFERGLLGKYINPKYDPTDVKNFVWYKKGAEVGSLIEGQDRLLNFVACLRNGKTPEEAAELTRKALFDYSDLTAFEKNVMKRIIPYYTWLRKNAALQLEMILEQPKKYMYISKVVHGIEGMVDDEDKINRAFVNEFAKDWVQTPFTVKNPEGRTEVVLWNPNLPYLDLGRIPNPFNIKGSVKELFTQTNPLIRVPIEQIQNYNYFFESPIVKDGGSQLNRVDHALNNFALYNFGTGMAEKHGVDLGLHVLNATSGLKFLSYDYYSYKYQKLDELRKKYGDNYKPQPSFGTKALDYLDSVIEGFEGSISYATSATFDKIYESRPTKASEYTNALRPISIAKYERLSDEEKKKYIPPTNDEVMVLNKKAVELEQKELEKTGKIKRYIWTFMENKNLGSRNKEFTFGEVVYVHDGDTFDVKIGDKVETVRMLLIDTPETVQKGMIPQPGGEIASNYTKKHLLGKDTKIVFDGSHRDKYDRILGYVEIDGEDYNQRLLDEGLAKLAYIYEPYYDRLEDYRKSEEKAYQQKKGIWSIPDYANPGGYGYFNTYYDEALVRKLNELMAEKMGEKG